jgi:hypothetical protein
MHFPWLAIGSLLESFSVKVKVLRGDFSLWLGDNIAILSMVKRAHPLYSNIVLIYEGIISDLIGFNDHGPRLVSINNHTHIGETILDDS